MENEQSKTYICFLALVLRHICPHICNKEQERTGIQFFFILVILVVVLKRRAEGRGVAIDQIASVSSYIL